MSSCVFVWYDAQTARIEPVILPEYSGVKSHHLVSEWLRVCGLTSGPDGCQPARVGFLHRMSSVLPEVVGYFVIRVLLFLNRSLILPTTMRYATTGLEHLWVLCSLPHTPSKRIYPPSNTIARRHRAQRRRVLHCMHRPPDARHTPPYNGFTRGAI